jgi:tRNA A37 threonylcarbamoyladenosine synthetase subunit TsaC/SUA5/YrdC
VTYYGLTFETAVRRQERPLAIVRVDPGEDGVPKRAVDTLRRGGLLVIPVDDGYVVGCAGTDAGAVSRLCELTGARRDQLMRLSEASDHVGAAVGTPATLTHPVPRALMRAAATSMVATAVPPGGAPAATAQHIIFKLGDAVDLVLDAGPARRLAPAVGGDP